MINLINSSIIIKGLIVSGIILLVSATLHIFFDISNDTIYFLYLAFSVLFINLFFWATNRVEFTMAKVRKDVAISFIILFVLLCPFNSSIETIKLVMFLLCGLVLSICFAKYFLLEQKTQPYMHSIFLINHSIKISQVQNLRHSRWLRSLRQPL